MSAESVLIPQLKTKFGRTHAVLCGRGTTALWLALRALARRDGSGEVILPDLLCATALDGVLLAGFTPVFADVLPRRFTLSAQNVAQLITPRTRAILVTHLFGHIADLDAIRRAAPDIPIIEDAVQGVGGSFEDRPAGSWGDLSFISFDQYKMIGGRGGALLFDDPALLEGIGADLARLNRTSDHDPAWRDLPILPCGDLLPSPAAAAYAYQLGTVLAPALLRAFDPSPANLDRILADWSTLDARVRVRNDHAYNIQALLADLPLLLPELRPGDAIWCYTLTLPSAALARRVLRELSEAGVGGSDLYYPLSRLVNQSGGAGYLTHRLVNLWADESVPPEHVHRMAAVINGSKIKLTAYC